MAGRCGDRPDLLVAITDFTLPMASSLDAGSGGLNRKYLGVFKELIQLLAIGCLSRNQYPSSASPALLQRLSNVSPEFVAID
jgi:hypothetical protein